MAVSVGAPRARIGVAVGLVLGALVAVLLGVYGAVHDPAGEGLFTLFFTGTINMKTWLATIALALAVFQVGSALRLYGKLGSGRPARWVGDAHRISGLLAFIISLPVAYHCLWSLGFETEVDETRRFVHSIAGSALYGAYATKVFAVRRRGLPKWMLPAVGGVLFAALVVAWYTSALWFFQQSGFPSF